MKKLFRTISAFFVTALMLIAAVGCSFFEFPSKLPKLPAPEVTIDEEGVASWGRVEHAAYYEYLINESEEKLTDKRSVQLDENQCIRVKAVSGSEEYADSEYSEVKTYRKSNVSVKLSVPQVSIDENGVASWNAIENAHYYIFVIDDGAEQTTSERQIQLSEGQSIKVKAASNDAGYENSEFSEAKTYDKSTPPPVIHEHADANEDGKCDKCGKSVTAELSFYAVNDLHGKFMDTDSQPGVDEFTTYLKSLYADDTREEILLSSGDMWQGTVESSSNKGRLMTEWMNEVGFASMTLGNHEYDWGADVLTQGSELANFPFLAINVTYNGKAVDYCRASTTVEKGGIKIGIIGAIGDCLSSISGDFSTGLKFATGSALTTLVKNESDRLRREEGCDFIVYSIHEGYESSLSGINSVTSSEISYYDTSLSNGYVDLVFEGHTHQSYILQDEYGVYHLQGGGENRYVSCVDVSYNTVTAKYTASPSLLGQNEYANSSLKDDPAINTIFNKYFPEGNPYTTVLGYNSSYKSSETICDTVAKLYYDKGVSKWGNQYNIVLGGGFLRLRSPYHIYAGNVTYAQLFSVLPFDNDIVLGRIRGSYLKSKFLETDNSDYHIYTTTSASAVSDNQYYYIIVDSYTSTYRYNNITEVARLNAEIYARDLLADFVSAGGWN